MSGRGTMRYINEIVAEEVISAVVGTDITELERYVAPHSRHGRDIFGMWDMIVYDRHLRMYYFLQVCYASKRRKNLIRHGLMDSEMYIARGQGVRYFLVTYKKRNGKYVYRVEELYLGDDMVVHIKEIVRFKTLKEIKEMVI